MSISDSIYCLITNLASDMKREFVCLVGEGYGLTVCGLNPKDRKAALVRKVEEAMRLTPCQVCSGPCKPEVHVLDTFQASFSFSSNCLTVLGLSFQSDDEAEKQTMTSRSSSIASTNEIAAAARDQTPGLQAQEVLGGGFVSSSPSLMSTALTASCSPPISVAITPTIAGSMVNNPGLITNHSNSSLIINHGLLRQSPNLPGEMCGSLDTGPRTSQPRPFSQPAGLQPHHSLGSHPHHQAPHAGQQQQDHIHGHVLPGQLNRQLSSSDQILQILSWENLRCFTVIPAVTMQRDGSEAAEACGRDSRWFQ